MKDTVSADPVAAQNPGLVETRAPLEFKTGRLVFKFPTADEDAAIFRRRVDVCVCSGPPVCVCSGPCLVSDCGIIVADQGHGEVELR